MADYTYIDKSGAPKTIQADSPDIALSLLRTNSSYNADPKSGVMPSANLGVANNQSGIMQSTKQISREDNQNVADITNKVNGGVIDQTKNMLQNGQQVPTNGANPASTSTNNGATQSGYSETIPTGFEYNLPPLDNADSKRVYGTDGRVYIQDKNGQLTIDPVGEQEYQKNRSKQKEIDDLNTRYDEFKRGLDTSHQQLIDSIKESARIQRAKMEELNKKTLGMRKVQGFRTPGVAEYTPELYTGILKKEEQDGLDRLAEIDANMNLLIAQAVQAKNEKDFELLNKRMSAINTLQQQKEDAVQTIYENSIKNAKFIQDKLKEVEDAERANADQAIQELKIQAPALVSNYDSLKTDAERQVYLKTLSEKTGLDAETILGQIETSRMDIKEKKIDLAKKEKSGTGSVPTATQTKANLENDIAEALDRFQEKIRNQNFYGIDPAEYEFYKTYLIQNYGYAAVQKLDKAISDAGIEIDYVGDGIGGNL